MTCPHFATVFISFLATLEKRMCSKMSQIATEGNKKLIPVLGQKQLMQPHSELNATDENSLAFHGTHGLGILHLLTH